MVRMPEPPPKRDFSCPICSESIDNILTAIAHGEHAQPAHLECVIRRLAEREQLSEDEQIAYIGEGDFAVLHRPSTRGSGRTEIRRRIEYEDKNHKPEWRRELSPGVSRDYIPSPGSLADLLPDQPEDALLAAKSIYLPKYNLPK
jgi:hypothetical protein